MHAMLTAAASRLLRVLRLWAARALRANTLTWLLVAGAVVVVALLLARLGRRSYYTDDEDYSKESDKCTKLQDKVNKDCAKGKDISKHGSKLDKCGLPKTCPGGSSGSSTAATSGSSSSSSSTAVKQDCDTMKRKLANVCGGGRGDDWVKHKMTRDFGQGWETKCGIDWHRDCWLKRPQLEDALKVDQSTCRYKCKGGILRGRYPCATQDQSQCCTADDLKECVSAKEDDKLVAAQKYWRGAGTSKQTAAVDTATGGVTGKSYGTDCMYSARVYDNTTSKWNCPSNFPVYVGDDVWNKLSNMGQWFRQCAQNQRCKSLAKDMTTWTNERCASTVPGTTRIDPEISVCVP